MLDQPPSLTNVNAPDRAARDPAPMKFSAIPLLVCLLVPVAHAGEHERELIRLVRQDCGSCHGMQLTGGLGLPLTPQALRGKPEETLVATVMYGRGGTPMPAWRTILSEQDAEWIVARLVEGFPQEQR